VDAVLAWLVLPLAPAVERVVALEALAAEDDEEVAEEPPWPLGEQALPISWQQYNFCCCDHAFMKSL